MKSTPNTGKSNENPILSQFVKNASTIRVIRAIWIDNLTWNCGSHISKKHLDFETAKKPLQKGKEENHFEMFLIPVCEITVLHHDQTIFDSVQYFSG